MTDPSGPAPEPANLRFLRILVTTLTAVMIAGLLVIVALFVIRFRPGAPTQLMPANVTLPDGTRPEAVTIGRDWYAVVTEDGRILIFDRVTGELRQSVIINSGG